MGLLKRIKELQQRRQQAKREEQRAAEERQAALKKAKKGGKPALGAIARLFAGKRHSPAAAEPKKAAPAEPGAGTPPIDAARQRSFMKLLFNGVFTVIVFRIITAVVLRQRHIALGPWYWILAVLILATMVLIILHLRSGKGVVQQVKKIFAHPAAKPEYQTDLDRLYELVQQKQSVKLGEVMKMFSIDRKKSEEWAAILEDSDLISIHYPAFGDPELRIKHG